MQYYLSAGQQQVKKFSITKWLIGDNVLGLVLLYSSQSNLQPQDNVSEDCCWQIHKTKIL